MTECQIIYETPNYWVKHVPKGHYEVYRTGLTHSTRVAIIGHKGQHGRQLAIAEADRRQGANGPRKWFEYVK